MFKIVPIYSPESRPRFVSDKQVPLKTIVLDGVTYFTGPLLANDTVDLLGISNTSQLLEAGLQDMTDSIDSAVVLVAVYIQVMAAGVAKEVFRFETFNLPFAVFVLSPDSYRNLNLEFRSRLSFTPRMQCADGKPSIFIRDYVEGRPSAPSVNCKAEIKGTINLETGTLRTVSESFPLWYEGNNIGCGLGEIIGFDILANRVNHNRRPRN